MSDLFCGRIAAGEKYNLTRDNNTYKPIVDDICARKAPGAEVEHLLDHMVGICHDDRMTELFKRVCRKYLYLYPEMITSEIYTYKEMYEEDDD